MNVSDSVLTIRPIVDSDAEDYFAVFSDPEICRYDDFPPMERSELPGHLALIQTSYADPKAVREYAIVLNAESRLIGVFCTTPKRKYVYIGYHLNRAFHGHGYATRATKLFIAAQTPARAALLRALIDPDNAPSIAVIRKCGFQLVRRQRSGAKRELVFAYTPPAAVAP